MTSRSPPSSRKRQAADAEAKGVTPLSKKQARRLRQQTPEDKAAAEYKKRIEQAAHDGNAPAAIHAYERLQAEHLPVNPYLYRVVINTCANAPDARAVKDAAFHVYADLLKVVDRAAPKTRVDETVYSALLKICARAQDFTQCHELLRLMQSEDVAPKLRTFAPLLQAYCQAGDLTRALAVDEQLRQHALALTEAEYVALFGACVATGNAEQFYRLLDVYIEEIEQPGPMAWTVLQEWFASDAASVDGRRWQCTVGTVDASGVCSVSGDVLQSLELPADQEEALLAKVENLVRTDDKRIEQWADFKAWMDTHGAFDVVIDAANVGYFNQNYSGGGFSYTQIDLMLKHYEDEGKRALIVLHKRRTFDDVVPEEHHALVQSWKERNVMYNCRSGNNDDWYWLYAAVKWGGRTLVVSNDEMRDHQFQMIQNRAFTRWKERHQVYYSIYQEKYVKVREPSVYSVRPQRVGTTWHFPRCHPADKDAGAGSDTEADKEPVQWLCFQLAPASEGEGEGKGESGGGSAAQAPLQEQQLEQ